MTEDDKATFLRVVEAWVTTENLRRDEAGVLLGADPHRLNAALSLAEALMTAFSIDSCRMNPIPGPLISRRST